MSSMSSNATAPVQAAQLIELPELVARADSGAAVLGTQAALLDSIAVSLSVVVGQTHTTLGELMRLKESALLTIDRTVDTPVDVVVNGHVVARGHLVVIDDSFGVRVTEVALAQPA
jgi:flagellar motor switch protein FliN/FliY